ncbi:RDD family protein [Sphingomonas sp. RHCKR7]|uniref:RDD family protein n=1 Tax=Sphingomonas folli TaxID=2862497 RepID=UPI001C66F61C|nr:RDD family protein [Sphingomonas folli]MBW6526448.1 RDD family protein [Sphingomonas folli]
MTRAEPRNLRRRLVTPEGVDLGVELGGAGARATAYGLDLLMMLLILVVGSAAMAYLLRPRAAEPMAILWLLGAFALRNGWFILFELGVRGATPGKRALGLRVIARDGVRLTGSAIVARNAVREVEVFLPLTFLIMQAGAQRADAWLAIAALGWSAIFLLFPLFNRDRLRMGDVLAGTWVVRDERRPLGSDLAAASTSRRFTEETLDLYGEYELHALEEVLRAGHGTRLSIVASAIRAKAGLADDGDDAAFLADYYAALCARLERRRVLGRSVADKWQGRG